MPIMLFAEDFFICLLKQNIFLIEVFSSVLFATLKIIAIDIFWLLLADKEHLSTLKHCVLSLDNCAGYQCLLPCDCHMAGHVTQPSLWWDQRIQEALKRHWFHTLKWWMAPLIALPDRLVSFQQHSTRNKHINIFKNQIHLALITERNKLKTHK